MLPLFHASGHFAYAKSTQIYLQDMADLENKMNTKEYYDFTKNGYFTIRRSDKLWSGVWTDMTIEQTLNRFFGTDLIHGRGVTPSVIARYFLAMPSVYCVMDGLEDFCQVRTANSEQHVDHSESRREKDDKDVENFVFWLQSNDPFAERNELLSFSHGTVGTPESNCHLAIEKGTLGLDTMVGKNVATVSLSSAYKVKNLAAARSGIRIRDEEVVSVDSTLLFQRLSATFSGDSKMTKQAFEHELAPFPMSLFDETGSMRKSKKSDLYKSFQPFLINIRSFDGFRYVIDGGWLLHYISWPHSKTFHEICDIYTNYIVQNFGRGESIVIFDGYVDENCGTKSYERLRRKQKNVAPDVRITAELPVTLNQTKFLSNIANKLQFVQLLAKHLQNASIQVKVANEDADREIVSTAINLSHETEHSVAIVGNDVDLFCLLIALKSNDCVYFYKVTGTGKNRLQVFSTSGTEKYKSYVLFAHAFSGCDTVSSFMGKGKNKMLSMLEKNETLRSEALVFTNAESTPEQLLNAAKAVTLSLYNAKEYKVNSLPDLRYKLFTRSISKAKKAFCLSYLPPTEAALREHAKRVFYQLQLWLHCNCDLDPQNWGWKKCSTFLMPVANTEDPAPSQLLKSIFCSCTKKCDSNKCSCRKAGLSCNSLCKNCNGETCDNPSKTLRPPDSEPAEGCDLEFDLDCDGECEQVDPDNTVDENSSDETDDVDDESDFENC